MKDRFIPDHNKHSYYPLLYLALEETNGDVLELGTGEGSTQLLHDYIKPFKDRMLFSFDEKEHYYNLVKDLQTDQHQIFLVKDWDIVSQNFYNADVVFIDHAPGERRKEDIVNFKDTKGILVIHDTEPAADHGYQMRQHFPLFKYKVEVKTNGAWATALSQDIDLTKWIGTKFGDYIISE